MNELNKQQKNKLTSERNYFTQIPNYIADHSTANDQALYLQIKRYAGEDGKCFATEKTLMKKLGKGKKAFNKAIKFLLDQKWVSFVGKTNGKTRPINTYEVADIWKMNNAHYEKINAKSDISRKKDKFPKWANFSQKEYKINTKRHIEEEPLLRRTKEEERVIPPEEQERINKIKADISKRVKKLKLSMDVKDNGP